MSHRSRTNAERSTLNAEDSNSEPVAIQVRCIKDTMGHTRSSKPIKIKEGQMGELHWCDNTPAMVQFDHLPFLVTVNRNALRTSDFEEHHNHD
jgi:hypothetical protein